MVAVRVADGAGVGADGEGVGIGACLGGVIVSNLLVRLIFLVFVLYSLMLEMY